MKPKTKLFLPLLIVFLGFFTRFIFIWHPAEVVFDEVHFGKFVSSYFTRQYYFDIHPPLGKLMVAITAKLFGFQAGFDFNRIGESFDKNNLFVLRFLPAFFGALLPILVYLIILKLGLSKKAAFLGAFLIIFDPAFLVQSKFILVDSFLLFFGFLAVYFFILSKQKNSLKKSYLFLAISAIFSALALSIKWTGLSFLGIIIFFTFLDFFKNRRFKNNLLKLIILIIVPFAIYLSIFAAHFKLLHNSGQGNAFMSPAFQKTLAANNINEDIKPLSFWQKFIELNKAMYKYNKNIKESHPFSSRWNEWPKAKKPIWYWTKTADGKIANIYFFGSPFVWWFTSLSVFFSIIFLFIKKYRKKIPSVIYFLIFGYFINLLPFIMVGRVTFLYHYLPSLIFAIFIFVVLEEKIFLKKNSKFSILLYFIFLTAVFLFFIFTLPQSYGFPVSEKTNEIYKILIQFLS